MSIKSSLIRVKVLYKNKEFLESIDICQKLLMKKPKLCDVRQVLALSFKEINNFEQAIVELNTILRVKPLDAETLCNMGSVYLSQSQFYLASQYFTNAIHSNSKIAVAYSNLAICQQRLGELEYAEKNYKQAIILGDKTAKAHLGLGTLYTA
jgi:Flp pilus assembly protein TadD